MTYGTGTITKERSGRYRVRIPDGHGGYRSVGTRETPEEAERLRAAALEEGDAMCLVGVELYEYGERVIERWKKAGHRAIKSDRSRWAAVVARAPFARVAVDVVMRADVRDFARALVTLPATRSVIAEGGKRDRVELDRPLSWQSQKHALGLLSRVFDEAVSDGLIAVNPCKGVKVGRRQARAEGWTWLCAEELSSLFALDLSPEQRAVFTVAVYQGLRLGEIAALHWDHVDLAAGWVVIAGSWDTGTKSGRVRRIPLLAPASEALRAWRPKAGARRGLVFPGAEGACYFRGYDWGWGDRRGGRDIPNRAGFARRVRFHDLRHTCAAHLISGSWGRAWRLAEVREYLGHTEESVTARYSHMMPDALHATARATAATPAATPDANPPRGGADEISDSARKLRKRLVARGTGFEPVAFGSGVPSEGKSSATIPQDAAALRLVLRRLLERAAAGDALSGAELAAAGLGALAVDPQARAALGLLSAIGTGTALRALAALAEAVEKAEGMEASG